MRLSPTAKRVQKRSKGMNKTHFCMEIPSKPTEKAGTGIASILEDSEKQPFGILH
jgi:hypothetical protein